MATKKMEQHPVSDRPLILVWIALILLTGVTIGVAHIDLGKWGMLANILIASAKAGLVLWFFMHLKYENRSLQLMLLIPIVTIAVIIGLTFFDTRYR